MGKQVNFYLTPSDTIELESKLRAKVPLSVLHSHSSMATPRFLESLDFSENDQAWLFFFLVRPEDVNLIVMEYIPQQGHWSIDDLRSPVIEFGRCFFDGHILRRGRLYYNDKHFGIDNSIIEKPEAFRKWAASIFSVTKKNLARRGTDYCGHGAETWLASSGGKLVGW